MTNRMNEIKKFNNILFNRNKMIKSQFNEIKKHIFVDNYDKKYLYEITYNNNNKVSYTLTPKTYQNFVNLVNRKCVVEKDNDVFKTSSSNERFNYKKIKSIQLKELERGSKIFQNKDNAFFKHLNMTDLDLKRYQIINKDDNKELIKEHCVIHSLRLCGIDESKLNSIKLSFLSGTHISLSQMDKICDFIYKKIIIHSYQNDSQRRQKKIYGKKYSDYIELTSFDNHMFVYDEKTKYNKYFIDNYEKLKDEKNRENIFKTNKLQKWYSKDDSKRCDSLYLVKKLHDKGLFQSNSLELRDTFHWNKLGSQVSDYDIPLDNIANESRLKKIKTKKPKKINVFYADTENFNFHGERYHQLMMIGVVKNELDKPEIFKVNQCNDYGRAKCIFEFLDYVKNNTEKEHVPIVYFHNLKYDYKILEKYVVTKNIVTKNNVIYSVRISYKSFDIELRDSFKFVNKPLKDFSKTFGLKKDLCKKDAIGYGFYNYKNYKLTTHNIDKYKLYLKDEDKTNFDEIIKKDASLFDYDEKNNTFNAVKYYEHYLKYDCKVLKAGFNTFVKIIKDNTQLDVHNYLTISSLSNRYFETNGAFEGLYEVKGNLREFISRSIRGGRTDVCAEFKKQHIKKRLCDFDGVSLYPSSIYRSCKEIGLPKGAPKILKLKTKRFLDTTDYYVVKIKLKKINKKQQNPFISVKDDKGILQYVNEAHDDILYVDKITLEDYVEFHDIEYEILQGVFWNEGYNKKMGELMETLFKLRLKYKKLAKKNPDCNAIQQVIKLMMNSAYGKTILGKSNTEVKYLKKNKYDKKEKRWTENSEAKTDYIYNYFNSIYEIRDVNKKIFCVKKYCVDDSYNLAQVGSLILSYSKRIMHEVLDTANNNKLNIYYTDTDSIHIEQKDIPVLEQKYNQTYNRELIGKMMCQFHTDFQDIEFDNGEKIEPVAIESIFLGKKSYIDKLEAKNSIGQVKHDYHYRMKGINLKALKHLCDNDKRFNGDMMKLFKFLSNGHKLSVVLNPTDHIFNWEYENNGVITKNNGSFVRVIKF